MIAALRKMRKVIRRRITRHAIILMYHRVASGVSDPWGLCVSEQNFAQHMEVLRRHYEPVRLEQLACGRPVRNRMVAVTFDDGYADNLHAALPILQQNDIPATFFLTSSMLGSAREFWWDELERLLLRPQKLPAALQVTLGSVNRVFDAGRAAGSVENAPGQVRSGEPWEAAPDTRLGFYYTIWRWLGTLAEAHRNLALARIRDQLQEPDVARDSHRSLTPEEVTRLADAEQVDIGAHSVTHAMLSTQPRESQRWEMRQSKQDLEALIGRPVVGFAYPHGDYGPETLGLASASGYEFACTVESGYVARTTPRLQLPRVAVSDCTGEQFVQLLKGVL